MVSQPVVQQPQEEPGLEVGFTWGLSIGVPIVLNVNRDNVRPGANINFFGAADFGFFAIGGAAGLQWTPIDLDGLPGLSGRHPLTRIYLSLPEVRFQVPDLKVVLPYITGSFDMNFWNFAETVHPRIHRQGRAWIQHQRERRPYRHGLSVLVHRQG
ncbi:MAG: hypothetical protein JRF54_15510 [Deltaproteobacteria bacterium]|nr:hypothetical protein [Deltaproteobacteria bacterium]